MSEHLILGATGKTGRRVVTALVDAGHTVRAAARTPGPAAPGVTPVVFDWDDTSTHDAALAGVDGVYVIPPALRLDHPPLIAAFLERAKAAGVGARSCCPRAAPTPTRRAPLALAERRSRRPGFRGPTCGPSWFAQNFTEGVFRPDDALVAARRDGAVPFVDAQDIAEVAAAALTGEGHAGAGLRALAAARADLVRGGAVLASTPAGRSATSTPTRPSGSAGAEAAGLPPSTPACSGCSSRRPRRPRAPGQRRRRARARPPGDVLRGLGRPRGRRPARPRPHARLTTHRASTSSAHR
jgi:uncharacterized protein YbjT (DUF2867 family)